MKMPALIDEDGIRRVMSANGTNLTGRLRPLERPHREFRSMTASWRDRVCLAWGVFTGKYDAITWSKKI